MHGARRHPLLRFHSAAGFIRRSGPWYRLPRRRGRRPKEKGRQASAERLLVGDQARASQGSFSSRPRITGNTFRVKTHQLHPWLFSSSTLRQRVVCCCVCLSRTAGGWSPACQGTWLPPALPSVQTRCPSPASHSPITWGCGCTALAPKHNLRSLGVRRTRALKGTESQPPAHRRPSQLPRHVDLANAGAQRN